MKCPKCGYELADQPGLQPIIRLTKDAIAAMRAGADPSSFGISSGRVGTSDNNSARMLVDMFYSMQEMRKRTANQVLAIRQGADPAGDKEGPQFILAQMQTMEDNARLFLQTYVQGHPLWPWFAAVPGIGPVLAAGLVAHLGGRPLPPTVGHWWRFAGLDPSQQWLGQDKLKSLWDTLDGDLEMRTRTLSYRIGRDPETVIRDATTNHKTGEVSSLTKAKALKALARIPYNRPLKTLCWKIGDSMVKLGGRQDAFYAKFYRDRKAREIARNENGERAELAQRTLAARPNHAQAAIYREGKLPDGRIDLMARRATVKLFLSHLHELWYREEHGKNPPHPFSTVIQGHAHYIPPPYQHVFRWGSEAA